MKAPFRFVTAAGTVRLTRSRSLFLQCYMHMSISYNDFVSNTSLDSPSTKHVQCFMYMFVCHIGNIAVRKIHVKNNYLYE